MKDLKPFTHKTIMTVLAFVLASGGYGGYRVVEHYQTYGTDFETRPHLVEEVIDGDTLIIENNIRIRLLNIDAPEQDACYGIEAKEQLSKLVLGKNIILEKDQTAKDSFNRLLRYVFIHTDNPEGDNVFLNKELVEIGAARTKYIAPNRRYLSSLQASEREAEESSQGLWNSCIQEEVYKLDREQESDPNNPYCVIKGNISSEYTKDYFIPGCPNYKRVKIDARKGEQWFCSEKEALDAGWQRSASCSNIWQLQETP